jgi:hypothetical protein
MGPINFKNKKRREAIHFLKCNQRPISNQSHLTLSGKPSLSGPSQWDTVNPFSLLGRTNVLFKFPLSFFCENKFPLCCSMWKIVLGLRRRVGLDDGNGIHYYHHRWLKSLKAKQGKIIHNGGQVLCVNLVKRGSMFLLVLIYKDWKGPYTK